MRRVLFFCAALLAATANGLADERRTPPQIPAEQSARAAPTLALRDARGGRTRRLDDYRGRVVLINFWATWCPPCRAEMPDLVKLQRQYGKSGLQILGVTYPDDDRRAARQLMRRFKINYPILWGTAEAAQKFEVAAALPVTVVIDRRGRIRERIEGILLPAEFTEKIEPLLRESEAGAGRFTGERSARVWVRRAGDCMLRVK